MEPTIVVRLDHPLVFDDRPEAAREVGEILTRPCFHTLVRACAEVGKRWFKYKKISAALIQDYLLDSEHQLVIVDGGRKDSDSSARARLSTGKVERDYPLTATALDAYVYVPFEPALAAEAVTGFCDLAVALDARSGSVSVEPDSRLAHNFGLASSPRAKDGFPPKRRREREARWRYDRDIATRVAGPEWGMFLGAGHLEQLSAAALRDSGVFHRVVELSPGLVFLQATADPADALAHDFDDRLDPARAVLAPILMDLSSPDLD